MHNQNKVIVRGADVTLNFHLRTQDGDCLDLSGATDVVVRFRKADRSALERKLSLGQVAVTSAINGRVQVELTDEHTNSLHAMPNAPVEIFVDFGETRRIAQIRSGLNVVERLI